MEIILTSPNPDNYNIESTPPFQVSKHLEICVSSKTSPYEIGSVRLWDLSCYIFHGNRVICMECLIKSMNDIVA